MKRVAVIVSLVLAFILTVFFGNQLVVSHYRRWQAARLLAVARQIHPGIDTEVQVRKALKSFSSYEISSISRSDESGVSEVSYSIHNLAGWTAAVAYHLRLLPFRVTLPGTLFIMHLRFEGGVLSEMRLIEMQEDRAGSPHPNSASVTVISNRLKPARESVSGERLADFNGYSEYSQSTGGLGVSGRRMDSICCHTRFIQLDERATPAQFDRAFNFQLHCLTSIRRCKDDREILP